MTDFDKDCDATLEAAGKTIAEGERLAGQCEAARRAREEWEQANGVDQETRQRFFASLSPEDRKKAEEENERFELELARDLEQAVPAPVAKKAGGGRRRSYA